MTDRLPESSLRLGLPSGSLQVSTFDLFGRAGYRVSVSDRSVFPRIDDEKISAVLFRAQEISRYVVDNIIVYGNDQTVFYKNGEPSVWDRGRELGMTNRIDRVPA